MAVAAARDVELEKQGVYGEASHVSRGARGASGGARRCPAWEHASPDVVIEVKRSDVFSRVYMEERKINTKKVTEEAEIREIQARHPTENTRPLVGSGVFPDADPESTGGHRGTVGPADVAGAGRCHVQLPAHTGHLAGSLPSCWTCCRILPHLLHSHTSAFACAHTLT